MCWKKLTCLRTVFLLSGTSLNTSASENIFIWMSCSRSNFLSSPHNCFWSLSLRQPTILKSQTQYVYLLSNTTGCPSMPEVGMFATTTLLASYTRTVYGHPFITCPAWYIVTLWSPEKKAILVSYKAINFLKYQQIVW